MFRVNEGPSERPVVQFTDMSQEIFSPVEVIVSSAVGTKAGGRLDLGVTVRSRRRGENRDAMREGRDEV